MVINKKGNILSLWSLILGFNIFIALAFTFLIGFNNMAGSEIIDPIHQEVSKVAEDRTSVEIQNHIDGAKVKYYENQIPWDLVMFGIMINFYFFILYSAIKTAKASSFTVFTLLTFGSIFLLLLISISVDVQQWILSEIYTDVFEDLSISTPIMDWVFLNIGMICFIMALVVVLVNQFDKLKNLVLGGEE